MVEGPGCTLNGEKFQGLRGKKVCRLLCPNNKVLQEKLKCFEGKTLMGADSLGKELFVYFDGMSLHCIRLHFGMNGSVYVNAEHRSFYSRPPPVASLHLELVDIVDNVNASSFPVNVYETTVTIVVESASRAKVVANTSLDVCSLRFCHDRAVDEVQKHSKRIVADVLLDQKVLPGCGNIIKNEALFDAGVNPNLLVGDLSSAQMQRIVATIRDFSMLFYDVRKKHKSLRKCLRVYNRDVCGGCGTKVVKCRLGNDMNRMTFFCPRCQGSGNQGKENNNNNNNNNDNAFKVTKPKSTQGMKETSQKGPASGLTPGRDSGNSLINWLKQTDKQTMTKEWCCGFCGSSNHRLLTSCSVCAVVRHDKGGCSMVNDKDNDESLTSWVCLSCAYVNENEENCVVCLSERSKFGRKVTPGSETSDCQTYPDVGKPSFDTVHHKGFKFRRKSEETPVNENERRDDSSVDTDVTNNTNNTFRHQSPTQLEHPVNGKTYSQRIQKDTTSLADKDTQKNSSPSSNVIPKCKHYRRCAVRMVRRSEENRGRYYFACAISGYQGKCDYFKWADDSFPLCGHGERTLLRTVLKQGSNNGRKFFCCGKKKTLQCGFFQWAEGGIVDLIESQCKQSNISDLG